MNLILFVGLLASASAAPRWRRDNNLPPPPPSPPSPSSPPGSSSAIPASPSFPSASLSSTPASPSSPQVTPSPLSDVIKRYLTELQNLMIKYNNEIIYNSGEDPNIRRAELEAMKLNISNTMFKDFPKYTEEIEGNEYIFTLPLIGYDKNDFVVRTRNGRLLIQVRNYLQDSSTGYGHDRILPTCVGEQANWSYENDLLKIVLPVIENCDSSSKEPTPETVTPGLDRSLTHDSERDTNVDLVRGDLNKTKEIQTNDTPKAEATAAAD